MMSATTHSFQASLTDGFLKSPGFFTSAFLENDSQNPFDDSFREKIGDPCQAIDPCTIQTPQGHADDTFLRPFSNGSFSPMFSFSPRPRSPAPIETNRFLTLDASSVDTASLVAPSATWNPQNPTPPNSARSPVVDNWKGLPDQSIPSMRAINTEPPMVDGKLRYGQITPPGGDELLAAIAFEPVTPPTAANNKRKRSVAKADATQQKAPKRRRKLTARAKSLTVEAAEKEMDEDEDDDGDDDDAEMGEDGKRSRFLERNRVAASKCRQKKKEWTNNLESRARDLQHQKSQLTAMVSSLKDEMLWLKGELLKHGTCGCDKIRQYLNHEATHFAAGTASRRQSHLLALSSPAVDSPMTGNGSNSHVASPVTVIGDPDAVIAKA